MFPAGDAALFLVDGGREAVHAIGAIEAALNVVLARPHVLDGQAHQLGRLLLDGLDDLCGFQHHVFVRACTATEAAAHVQRVDGHALGLEAQGLGHYLAVEALVLRAYPDLAAICLGEHRAVQWLHGGVCQIGHRVFMGEHFLAFLARAGGVALFDDCRALVQCGLVLSGNFLAAHVLVGTQVPLHLQQLASTLCRPEGGGDHRHAVRQFHNRLDTGDGRCGFFLEADQLRTHGWRAHYGGGQHVG